MPTIPNIPKIPPNIPSVVEKLAPQEIAFYKEAMKLDLSQSFDNILDVPYDIGQLILKISIKHGIMSHDPLYEKAKSLEPHISVIRAFGVNFYSDSPTGVMNALNIANTASSIDNKLGESTSASDNIANTTGVLSNYAMAMSVYGKMVDIYNTTNIGDDDIIESNSTVIASANINTVLDNSLAQCDLAEKAILLMNEQKIKVLKFSKLSNLKSNFNIPSINYLLSGDIAAALPVPPIIKSALLQLLKLPGKL